MLIITRKLNEKIIIDDNTIVTLLDIKDNQVRLGIDAPRHIRVHRQEVYQRIKEANLESLDINDSDVMEALSVLKGNVNKEE
jgi:carbon storage regulator